MPRRQFAKQEDTRRKEQAIFVVQIFGALLLIPPLLNLFNTRTVLFGLPLEVLYLFLVWVLLIACAIVISLIMPRAKSQAEPRDTTSAMSSEAGGGGE